VFRDLYDVTMRIYREYTPKAARAMIKMAEEAESENVRLYALNLIMERALGKPKDFDPEKEADGGIDFAKMSDKDLAALIDILRRSSPAADVVDEPASGFGVVIEGEVIDNKK
jgi:hypothetical protein